MAKDKTNSNPKIDFLPQEEINKIIMTIAKDAGLSISRAFSPDCAALLAEESSTLLKVKAKIPYGTYKDIPTLTENLASQIKRLGIDSFYKWYMDKGQYADYAIDGLLKPNEGYIENKIFLPNNLTTEQQITLGSLLGKQMLDSNRKKSDLYELHETVPLLLNYLLHKASNGGRTNDAVQGLIIRTGQIGREYNSLYGRTMDILNKFHSLKPNQIETLATVYMNTEARFTSTQAALHIIGEDKDFRKDLSSVMKGDIPVREMLYNRGIFPSQKNGLPEVIRQYVKSSKP